MKKWTAIVVLMCFICGSFFVFGNDQGKVAEAASSEELRGVWIASVYNIDYPSQPAL